MDTTSDHAKPLVDLRSYGRVVSGLVDGSATSVDLSALVHDTARHGDLVACSAFAWWLLSTSVEPNGWELVLPPAGSSPLRHLARAGLITAALGRGVSLRHADGDAFRLDHLHADRRAFETRLPGLDWAVLDEPERYDRLRIIDDLPDPRRAVPRASGNQLAYAWLGNLGLASVNITADGYSRFLANADEAIIELVENVHRWSEASHGVAVVSCTCGGGAADGGPKSWNRLHVVIADDGIGIPAALRRDLEALQAVSQVRAGGRGARQGQPARELPDDDLVKRLILHAFGERDLDNHNGHGLNAAQVRAGQWVGALDIFTTTQDGGVLRFGSRGLNHDLEHEQVTDLPLARGTLVHLMLQATDKRSTRQSASDAERLPFVDLDDVMSSASAGLATA